MRILIRGTENDFMFLMCIVLFMMSDSLIAFQCSLIYCIGIYIMVLLKLVYESPRPFWMKETIHTYNNQCDFDYGSPSQHVFNLAFFWVYCIFMYFQKYTQVVNKPLIGFLYIGTAITLVAQAFSLWVYGVMYLYQCFVTLLYSLMYFIICVNIDNWIQNKCEQIGFIARKSRKYKFLLLFLCIGLYLAGYILFSGNKESWANQQIWIINAGTGDINCREQLYKMGASRLGLTETFNWSCGLFYIVGMGFGCSYSLVEVDCMNWIKTSFVKRLIRAILAIVLSVLMFLLLTDPKYISLEDESYLTEFFVRWFLPYSIIPFVMYGPYLILCQKLRLVYDPERDDVKQ